MGKDEEPPEEVEVEFGISMHCKACERKVVKVVSKIKGNLDEGVERIMTDMNNHRVVVTGRFCPEKVLKKLKKKTGKRVEIVVPEEQEDENAEGDGNSSNADDENLREVEEDDRCDDIPVFTMFSDENANACSIM